MIKCACCKSHVKYWSTIPYKYMTTCNNSYHSNLLDWIENAEQPGPTSLIEVRQAVLHICRHGSFWGYLWQKWVRQKPQWASLHVESFTGKSSWIEAYSINKSIKWHSKRMWMCFSPVFSEMSLARKGRHHLAYSQKSFLPHISMQISCTIIIQIF